MDFQPPNIDPEKVNITIENDVLTVSGASESSMSEARRITPQGDQSRRILLVYHPSDEGGGDKAAASYEKGILTITAPKAEEAKAEEDAVTVNELLVPHHAERLIGSEERK